MIFRLFACHMIKLCNLFPEEKKREKNIWPQHGKKDQWIQDQMNKGMTTFWIAMHSWVHNVTMSASKVFVVMPVNL